ncbi:restriction endonuclease subunit S [Devosia sp.]|uniref:restriction endonuclease subunit S n=1 Tax=Devosia sp. TaxID=1871048 RepID=UPI002732FC6F|nr:restriction endonuclease subunit S [Devosia sp.]MDP2780398.1 restriction endonuclease subunit S [Devosia sp.]
MVKPGYKQTEVGEIPEDWDVKKLGDLGSVVRGGSPRPAGDPRFFDGNFIPWLTVASLTNVPKSQIEIVLTDTHLTEEGSKRSRTLEKGTLIISNSGATLGVAKILGMRCCANDGIAAIINQKSGNKRYIAQFINTKTKYLHDVVASGNGQPNLNTSLIREIFISFPDQEEQNRIADALSDVDALIASLERLIEKKRDIKTATMQQLLTGKKRLPGFGDGKGTKQSELGEIPEDWDIRKYGDTFSFLSTANNSRADLSEDGDVEYIHYGDIHTKLHFNLDLERQTLPKIDRDKLRNPAFVADGDIVMADASEDYEGIGKSIEISNVGTRRVVSGLHTFLLRDTERRYANGFRGYLHSIPAIKRAYDTLATGLKVYGLSKNSLKSVSIPVPPFDEQVEIVKVISCMDDELHVLEEKLNKAKAIKQGMMQELLTGRTRLV